MKDPGLAPGSECSPSPQLNVFNEFVAGTPEAGGWTSREVKRIIRGLAGLNFVSVFQKASSFHDFTLRFPSGADIVEVAPAYDHGRAVAILLGGSSFDEGCVAEITATAAADIVHDFLSMFVSSKPPKPASLPGMWSRDEL